MEKPLEIIFRDVRKDDKTEALIRRKAQKLERVAENLTSCEVTVEQPHAHQRSGSGYRVRITLRAPPGHELVVRREAGEGHLHESLTQVINETFDRARRRLKALAERRQGETKVHPEQDVQGVVVRLFPEQDYGFLKSVDTGEEVYFQRESVLHDDYDRLREGTGVRFKAAQGEAGPQATTVEVVDKPGERAHKGKMVPQTDAAEPPPGW
jgi:cold shock CspA family protein